MTDRTRMLFNNLIANPSQVMARSGFNVPQSLNNPQDIIQHLLNTGQITQDQVNRAMAMKNNPILAEIFSGLN